jgi:hypothetical protein
MPGVGDRMVMRLKLSVKGMRLQSVGPWSWALSGGDDVGDVTASWGCTGAVAAERTMGSHVVAGAVSKRRRIQRAAVAGIRCGPHGS